MPDELPFAESGPDELVLKAMLYVSGELDPAEAALFEQRLAEDQSARDALCQAVELTQSLGGDAPLAPDPGYRSRVKMRLRIRRRHRLGLTDSTASLLGHPAFWSVLGAAIAVLTLVILSHILTAMSMDSPDTSPPTQPVPPSTVPNPLSESDQLPEDPATRAQRLRLQLQIQKVEAQMHSLLAELKSADDAKSQQLRMQLQAVVRELVDLDAQVLACQAEQLTKDLSDVQSELTRTRDNIDQIARQRYEALLKKGMQ